MSCKNIFKIEILSLPVLVRTVRPGGRSGGASFHFAQNDNELSMQKLLVWACHSDPASGGRRNLIKVYRTVVKPNDESNWFSFKFILISESFFSLFMQHWILTFVIHSETKNKGWKHFTKIFTRRLLTSAGKAAKKLNFSCISCITGQCSAFVCA